MARHLRGRCTQHHHAQPFTLVDLQNAAAEDDDDAFETATSLFIRSFYGSPSASSNGLDLHTRSYLSIMQRFRP